MSIETREQNMKTWDDIGLLITSGKEWMADYLDGFVSAEETMTAFGAGKNRPRCEKCKHNWACIPFCHYKWHPNTDKWSPMREGFIPHDVYVGERPCPNFAPAE